MIENKEFLEWLEKEKSIHLMPVNMYNDTKYAEDIKIERIEEHYCYIGHYYRCAVASIIRQDELIGLMTIWLLDKGYEFFKFDGVYCVAEDTKILHHRGIV